MDKILVVDIETSGFSFKDDVIFEIGIVELNLADGEIQIIFDSVVKEPHLSAKHRDAWIFQNSDLTQDMVRNAPLMENVRTEIQGIFDFYNGMTAYNRKFDFGFLRNRNFSLPMELPCPMILLTDVMKLPSKNGYPGFKYPSAQEAWDYLFPESPYQEKHRGADDARIEAMIVYEMYRKGLFVI